MRPISIDRQQALVLVLGVALALEGCAANPPPPQDLFPTVPSLDESTILRILAERAGAARTLYAVLDLDLEGPERSGAFEGVFHYRAPDSIRMTAMKDLVLAWRLAFDLVLSGEEYWLETEDDEGRIVRDAGRASAFCERHPELSNLFWVREAFCAPGSCGPGASRHAILDLERAWSGIESRLSSGACVTWWFDPHTLRIDRATIVPPDRGAIELVYGDYVLVDGAYVARNVVLVDGPTTVEARAREVEVDPELEDWIFDTRLEPR